MFIKIKIDDFIKENIGESHQDRFDRSIYLTYIQLHKEKHFKKVSKELYYRFLLNLNFTRPHPNQKKSKLKEIKTTKYTNKYRTCDKIETWIAKDNSVMGEVWSEGTGNDYVESYWINMFYYE